MWNCTAMTSYGCPSGPGFSLQFKAAAGRTYRFLVTSAVVGQTPSLTLSITSSASVTVPPRGSWQNWIEM